MPVEPTTATVPLREGPPTREELLVHYPAKFTWHQLRTFVNSGYVPVMKRGWTRLRSQREQGFGAVEAGQDVAEALR